MRAFETSQSTLRRTSELTPLGVHSNVRASERPTPLFFTRGHGSHLIDVDGNDYIDYVLGQGPMVLGHTPAPVIEAVRAQLERGILFGGQHELEAEAAARVKEVVPCAERLRFNVTGTEAIQSALRLARAATGRSKIVKFAGHYHGWADSVVVGMQPDEDLAADGTIATAPASAGVSSASTRDMLVTRWNDVEALETVVRHHGHDVAAVIMEPIMGNSGVVEPSEGYLEAVRDLCTSRGIILIFDEVITGFRVALGGAQERLGVVPDLAVFGKAMGSGFPTACVAGRAELFDPIESRAVLHAGTFNAGPVSVAAVNATVGILAADEGRVFRDLEASGTSLMLGLTELFDEVGAPFRVSGLPMFFMVVHTNGTQPDGQRRPVPADPVVVDLAQRALERGVRIQPRGNLFLSTEHSAADIAETVRVFREAIQAGPSGR